MKTVKTKKSNTKRVTMAAAAANAASTKTPTMIATATAMLEKEVHRHAPHRQLNGLGKRPVVTKKTKLEALEVR